MNNVVFVSSTIPSRFSINMLSTLEMCNAFSKIGLSTTLCVPKFNLSKESLFEYYGIEYPFDIIHVKIPQAFFRGTLPGRGVFFALLASNRLNKMEDHVVYSRNPWVFFILSVRISSGP